MRKIFYYNRKIAEIGGKEKEKTKGARVDIGQNE